MFGADPDEHLQLLQLSARRQQDHVYLDANQGPFETLAAGSECPDDQLLTLHQCAEASWGGAVQNVNQALQTYGPMVAILAPGNMPFPRGCSYWTANRGVYYNPAPPGVLTKPNAQIKPVCGANGGRLAEKQEEAALPAGGVEKRPVNTVCDECGILSLDQCKLAGDFFGVSSQALGNKFAGGYPVLQSNANASKINGPSPRGCFFWTQNKHMYFNFDSETDPDNSAPHPQKQPICGVCDTTTTTTPAPPEEIVSPLPGDNAEAVGDPHIVTNNGEHFDMQD